MMNQGYINFNYTQKGQDSSNVDESNLSKTLCKRSSFISLRRAIYTQTVQIIIVYRQAIERLMALMPLAEHIDLKDHYLAFIDLEKFGIQKDLSDDRLSVRQLKDTIQLCLLQQSEYLRRFSLTFCQKVREDNKLNKSGVLKHVKEIISKLRTVSDKMGNILEYHQALGLVPIAELDQRSLSLKKQQSLDQVKKLMPLRNVYTSLFSTGLHLQNSLLKVRQLEGFFEALEKCKYDPENLSNIIPNEAQLLEWLQGFQEIQTELNVCLTCLDDGVEEIDYIARPNSSRSIEESEQSATESSVDTQDNLTKQRIRIIDDENEIAHMDEIFEAFITRDKDQSFLGFDDDFVTPEEKKKSKKEKRQSKKVLQELKTVLVGKQKEWEVREARAMARQAKVDQGDEDNFVQHDALKNEASNNIEDKIPETDGYLSVPRSFIKTNILGLSQETDSDAESIRSDTNTIKSPESESKCFDDSLNGFHDSKSSNTISKQSEGPADAWSLSSLASRTLSDSSDSNMSDVEVDKSHKIYSCTMSSSYCKGDKTIQTKNKDKKLADLRSLSTPDFKQFNCAQVSSPYVSLEMLDDPAHEGAKSSPSPPRHSHSFFEGLSESSSDSSSGLQMLGKPKLFKRPIRPAAYKGKGRISKSMSVDKESQKLQDELSSNEVMLQNHSKYFSKQRDSLRDIQVNSQPCGFDKSLAADAVARSRQMFQCGAGAEEYFGSSESESSNI